MYKLAYIYIIYNPLSLSRSILESVGFKSGKGKREGKKGKNKKQDVVRRLTMSSLTPANAMLRKEFNTRCFPRVFAASDGKTLNIIMEITHTTREREREGGSERGALEPQ